ncbi:MAG: LuxR C-terminal-related transcriptional regulator [Pseudomonadota bacterium]
MGSAAAPTYILVSIDEPALSKLVADIVRQSRMLPIFSEAAATLSADLAPELSGIVTEYSVVGVDRDAAANKLKGLRRTYVGVPILAIIEDTDVVLASEALAAGAKDFIRRSTLIDELAFRLDVLLAPFGHEGPAPIGSDPASEVNAVTPPAAYLIGTPFERLTQRELDVMLGVVAGHANKMIAHRLNLSPKTVELHRARVMEKAGVRTLSHLVRVAVKAGIDPKFED